MNRIKLITKFAIALIIVSKVDSQKQRDDLVEFAQVTRFNKCEDKDSGNYTRIAIESTQLSYCLIERLKTLSHQIIDYTPNGEKSVSILHPLATSRYTQGSYFLADYLSLAIGGLLQGKFIYIRISALRPGYLKGCASVMGWSLLSSKNAQLLIADKLDPSIFISTGDALEQFKRGATAICRGEALTLY